MPTCPASAVGPSSLIGWILRVWQDTEFLLVSCGCEWLKLRRLGYYALIIIRQRVGDFVNWIPSLGARRRLIFELVQMEPYKLSLVMGLDARKMVS